MTNHCFLVTLLLFTAWTCSFNKQDFCRKINKWESLIRAFASLLFHLMEGFSLQRNYCAALMGEGSMQTWYKKRLILGQNTLLEENAKANISSIWCLKEQITR